MIGAALGFLTGGSFTRLGATLLVGIAIGGTLAHQVHRAINDRATVKRIGLEARDTLRQVENRDRASGDYQTGQGNAEQKQIQIVERVRVINARPAGAVQCLDADGLRELGAAIDNGAPAATGPSATVPASGPPN